MASLKNWAGQTFHHPAQLLQQSDEARHVAYVYWQPGSLKLAIRVCQPAVDDIWPANV